MKLISKNENLQPILEMEDGYHPCMKLSDDFIPNGITLGGVSPPLALLTGPNMGGKSTLMRQVAILVIMAQMVTELASRFLFLIQNLSFIILISMTFPRVVPYQQQVVDCLWWIEFLHGLEHKMT